MNIVLTMYEHCANYLTLVLCVQLDVLCRFIVICTHSPFLYREPTCYTASLVTSIVRHWTAWAHWDLGKMAANLQTTVSCVLLNENVCTLIQISLRFVPKCPIANKSALVQVIACRLLATSHYLNQWWPNSLMFTYGVARPKWVDNWYYHGNLAIM